MSNRAQVPFRSSSTYLQSKQIKIIKSRASSAARLLTLKTKLLTLSRKCAIKTCTCVTLHSYFVCHLVGQKDIFLFSRPSKYDITLSVHQSLYINKGITSFSALRNKKQNW